MSSSERRARLLLAFHCQNVLLRLEQSRFETGERLDPEDDLPNILKSQAWCAENAATDDAAATMCSKLSGVAGHWLEQRLNRVEQIHWREAGLAAAERLGNVEEQVAHLTHPGFSYFMEIPTRLSPCASAHCSLAEIMGIARRKRLRSTAWGCSG
jgi:hypothetical protein